MSPLVSSHCYDLAVIAAILGVGLLAAVVGLCIHIRNAVLGARLMKACGGDYKSAAIAIENVRAENEFLHEAMTRGIDLAGRNLEVTPEFRLRLARFNEDTQ